jgi:elongation factor 1-gamma
MLSVNAPHQKARLHITGFWEMFDPEGYSLWFCDYKFNDENTVTFVTMNKVDGFLQRMDLAHKYAFAKMYILGEEALTRLRESSSSGSRRATNSIGRVL